MSVWKRPLRKLRDWTRTDDGGLEGPSISIEDAQHNQSYTDPDGNTYNRTVGVMAQAGYRKGDRGPTALFHTLAEVTNSTSQTSYTANESQTDWKMVWDFMFPSDVNTKVSLSCATATTSDTQDIRVQNVTDNETILEDTAVDADSELTLGPTLYEPTTTNDNVIIRVQTRSQEGSDTVTVFNPHLYIVPQL